jgi:hypothetical protein
MIKKYFALMTLLVSNCLFAAPAANDNPVFSFSKNGKLVKKLTVLEMKKLVGESQLKTIEPHNKTEMTYIGLDFDKLLSAVYGESWKQTKKINFTCLDGYNPLVDHNLFLKHDAYLTYAKLGSKEFSVKKNNDGGKVVDMRPFYLTWDTEKSPILNNVNNRPYQLTAIDLLID